MNEKDRNGGRIRKLAPQSGTRQQRAYILGCGRFGSRAFAHLQPRFKTKHITVIDIRYPGLVRITAAGGNAVVADAVSFLSSSKEKMAPDDWIIPAVPIHVAYEWLRRELEQQADLNPVTVPEALTAMLPNPIRGPAGQLYASNADFICPDDCPEPEDCCTVTGRRRPRALCDMLSNARLPGFHFSCIVSSQLAPGVGGYQVRTLQIALQEIESHPGDIIVSTACKCHGVIHAFSLAPEG